jgi:hypothetical protein
MRDNLKETLTQREIESILLSLIDTNKDNLMIDYLNSDGRVALFKAIIKEYPIKRVENRVLTTVLVYNLVKSLSISRPLKLISELMDSKPENITQRIEVAKKRGYMVDRSPIDFALAKQQYIEAMKG